jgi:hypothetical protein
MQVLQNVEIDFFQNYNNFPYTLHIRESLKSSHISEVCGLALIR